MVFLSSAVCPHGKSNLLAGQLAWVEAGDVAPDAEFAFSHMISPMKQRVSKDWGDFRLTRRLALPPDVVEPVYSMIAEIDAVKTGWRLSGKLLPQTLERLTQSVLVTSTGSSNRIEGNRLNDAEVVSNGRNDSVSDD